MRTWSADLAFGDHDSIMESALGAVSSAAVEAWAVAAVPACTDRSEFRRAYRFKAKECRLQ